MKTLSERVELIFREHPDLDQPALARIAGVTKGTVNQWLDGKIKSMKMEYAVRIERELGYRAGWLVMAEPPKLVAELSKKGPEADINSPKKPENDVLSIESVRQERAKLMAEELLDVSEEMRALIAKLIQADHEGGAIREMTIAGAGYVLQAVPVTQTQKKASK
jgi:transcriptional regulator with XRE-family HTH domain